MPIPNNATAVFAAQAEPDALDFEIIQAGMNGTGVISGCACTAGNSGVDLSVAVASGSVVVAGTVVAVTSGTVTPGAASGSNPRFDLVVVNSSGTKSVIAGTAAASPAFPAASAATYAVLAAVYIPTSATSITTVNNLTDKRQLLQVDAGASTPSLRTLGPSSAVKAASGDHTHAGEYASTAHGTTHDFDGSDPLGDIGPTGIFPVRITASDGTGFVRTVGQGATPTSEMTTEVELEEWVVGVAWRPVRMQRSYWLNQSNRFVPTDALWGPDGRFLITPGTGGTPEKVGAPFTSTGTITHPTMTVADGFCMNLATAGTANATASIASTDSRWMVGNVVNPWMGLWAGVRIMFPDAAYNNTGASTGTRIWIGFTDQSVATILGSDTPVGHRVGFQYVNVNAGKTQTTWQFCRRDGTTESLTNTTVGITQNKWMDFWIHVQPNYLSFGNMYGQIDNVTDNTLGWTAPATISTNGPLNTQPMRFVVGLQSFNAVARNFRLRRIAVECPVD